MAHRMAIELVAWEIPARALRVAGRCAAILALTVATLLGTQRAINALPRPVLEGRDATAFMRACHAAYPLATCECLRAGLPGTVEDAELRDPVRGAMARHALRACRA